MRAHGIGKREYKLATVLVIVLSACAKQGNGPRKAALTMDSILTNSASRVLNAKLEVANASCMKREGFKYQALPVKSFSRTAGPEDHFTLAERRSIGFGVSSLVAPPPIRRPWSTEPSFQDSLNRCRKLSQTASQSTMEAIFRVGSAYFAERKKAEQSRAFLRFRSNYSNCMTRMGFPRVKTSEDAFEVAMRPYKAGQSLEEIRKIEIPLAVADFRCVKKNEEFRQTALAEAQAKIRVKYFDELTLIRTIVG